MKECIKVIKMLSRYADKEVSPAERTMIEMHLCECSFCSRELSELNRVKSLVSGLERKTLPENYLISKLRNRIAGDLRLKERFSLAGIGLLARRFIPVPIAIMAVSLGIMIFMYTQPITDYSWQESIFSNSAVTTDAALELVLGKENFYE